MHSDLFHNFPLMMGHFSKAINTNKLFYCLRIAQCVRLLSPCKLAHAETNFFFLYISILFSHMYHITAAPYKLLQRSSHIESPQQLTNSYGWMQLKCAIFYTKHLMLRKKPHPANFWFSIFFTHTHTNTETLDNNACASAPALGCFAALLYSLMSI